MGNSKTLAVTIKRIITKALDLFDYEGSHL